MNSSKVLGDLIVSATSAKAHFEIWWAQVSEARPVLVNIMNGHSDFFNASADAHYMAFFVCIAHLYDKRHDSSSIPTYLRESADTIKADSLQQLQIEYGGLAARAAPLITARHKTVAHIDGKLSEKEVFAALDVTWNEVRAVVYDSARYVAKLAGTSDLGSIGICRDRRLSEATLRLIRSLSKH